MLMSVSLRVSTNTIASNRNDVGVHTKMSLNVRHRVVSPAGIAERTASLKIRNHSTRVGYAASRKRDSYLHAQFFPA